MFYYLFFNRRQFFLAVAKNLDTVTLPNNESTEFEIKFAADHFYHLTWIEFDVSSLIKWVVTNPSNVIYMSCQLVFTDLSKMSTICAIHFTLLLRASGSFYLPYVYCHFT